MYRFFGSQSNPLRNIYFISNQANVQYSTEVCSFCRVHHRKTVKLHFISFRPYSGSVKSAELPLLLKGRKLQRGKYAELLEVNDTGTSNKKAAVRNINAANLSKLVNGNSKKVKLHKESKNAPKVSSAGLKKLEDIYFQEEHETNENDLSYIPEKNIDLVMQHHLGQNILDSADMDSYESSIMGRNYSNVKVDNDRTFDSSSEVKDLPSKEEQHAEFSADLNEEFLSTDHFLKHLLSYLDVYVKCGRLRCAEATLLNVYRKRDTPKFIEPYNCVLDVYALKGNLFKVLQILQCIKDDAVQPNPQTFASVYECIMRTTKLEKRIELLEGVKLYMDKCQISFLDVLNKSRFRPDQREHVIKAINLLDANFEPVYYTPDLQTDCKLLQFKHVNNTPPAGIPSLEELRVLAKEQIQAEINGEVEIKSLAWTSDASVEDNKRKILDFEENAVKLIKDAFDTNLKCIKQTERYIFKISSVLSPFLECLPKQIYVNAILQVIRELGQASDAYSLSLSTLHVILGNIIYRKYEIYTQIERGTLQKTEDMYMEYLKWYANDRKGLNSRYAWELIKRDANTTGLSVEDVHTDWPVKVRAKIGKFLYDIILNDVKVTIDQPDKNSAGQQFPAFYSMYRHEGKYLKEQIKPHPYIVKLYQDHAVDTLRFHPTLLPTLCPPRPWTEINSGGYLITKSYFMRMIETAQWQQLKILRNQQRKKLFPAMDALNQLGSIPWRINTSVLDIIIEIFRNGGSEELNVPQPSSALEDLPPFTSQGDRKIKMQDLKHRLEHANQKRNMYSLWCDALYKLSIANHYRNSVIWLPHNLDFRGRVYPLPPHLHHMSSDLGRSILLFAEGKPLGPTGLKWLKIHVINLTGRKKTESEEERLKFADTCLEDIIDSAENPMTGRMWWANSDHPWQTLAACMELTKALRSPNPEEFVSTIPIHQDGSCNGLQHYAALGRDSLGARAVNLTPCERPQDVYSVVVTMVEKARQEDEKNGLPIAKILRNYITRKVIKQTIMTTVYGVTKYGAELQIKKQLKAQREFPEEKLVPATKYVTEKTFDCLGTMFSSARNIQNWLTNCAKIITQKHNQYILWIAPHGLPILQAYNKKKIHNISSSLCGKLLMKPDIVKQKNAFAPNFIHSLDASHMLLTSLHCETEGITFVAVHDCYWTHACTADRMNVILREQFVALHSEPILENLSKFFLWYYNRDPKRPLSDGCIVAFSAVPEKGEFDVQNVLGSTYFFS